MQLLNGEDYRKAARRFLPKGLFEYIDRGTEDEFALAGLRRGLDAIALVPRVLTGCAEASLSTSILGRQQRLPLIYAPTALAGLVSYRGEVQLARAAARLGIPVCLSTQSVNTIEEVRAGAPTADIWFQLYLWKDRALTRALLARVIEAGADTLVVTADTPASPKREYNQRNGFGMPIRPGLRNALDVARHPRWLVRVLLRYLLAGGMPTYGHYPVEYRTRVTRPAIADAVRLEDRLSWADLEMLRREWPGRVLVKGVLSRRDAERARDCGADGIVVSAHGARNLDCAPHPAAVLPEIADMAGARFAVLADSGVRRGSDVLKYIARGAQGVMIGRLPLWGLAAGGEDGAVALTEMLTAEMLLNLRMLGCADLAELAEIAQAPAA